MYRIPNVAFISTEELTFIINKIIQNLSLIDPSFNDQIGQAEPPSEYLTDGRLAYADGTNWNPAGDGTKGLFRYNGGTSAWVYIG
jgi:hypothetical protein